MTLPADSAEHRIRNVRQLYDDWHGHYDVLQLQGATYVPIRTLTRAEALLYRCKRDEALQIVARQRGVIG